MDAAPTGVGIQLGAGVLKSVPFSSDPASHVLRFDAPDQGTYCIGLAK